MKLAFEVELSIPAEQAWQALVDPEIVRSWYWGLRPEGDWRVGGGLTWSDAGGNAAEEATIRELAPPRRLVLESHFVFTPAVSADPAHLATWEVESRGGGSLVRQTREIPADNATAAVLRNDGDGSLQNLRMAVDPVAQAEVARLDSIGEVEVRDVTPERVADYQRFFDQDAFRDYPAWRGCYCMEPLFSGSDQEWAMRSGAENRAEVSRRLTDGKTTALLAYVGDRPVGWCHYGPSTRLEQVMRRYDLKAEEQQGVGSIGCFIIAAPYRGHGVARRLLEAACKRLRESGLEWVEAYPREDPDSPQGRNFRGPLSLYQAAGFQPHRKAGPTQIVRKKLTA